MVDLCLDMASTHDVVSRIRAVSRSDVDLCLDKTTTHDVVSRIRPISRSDGQIKLCCPRGHSFPEELLDIAVLRTSKTDAGSVKTHKQVLESALPDGLFSTDLSVSHPEGHASHSQGIVTTVKSDVD
ncbi:unnamed protein product [Leuciscus chuanchicus]